MQIQSTFSGFNFNSIWTMYGNADYLYPELRAVEMDYQKVLQSIAVASMPTKLTYIQGKDDLDVSGGKITLTYNNNTTEVIDMTNSMISGFNNTNIGKQSLTVTYQTKKTTFKIEVVRKSVEYITVSTLPSKLTYLTGEESLDVTGGKITLHYNDGTTEVRNITSTMISGFDNTKVGKQSITVSYSGKTVTFEVEIIRKAIMGDVNGDSSVNSIDALFVLKYSVGKMQLTDEQKDCADVNGDGKINSVDALLILKFSVGKIEKL